MIGRTYLERGEPVVALARWAARQAEAGSLIWHRPPRPGAPRNVLILRADGSRAVRPFRGLRRPR
jgi:hypothetical protein